MSNESFIKTPKQLITVVILAFIIPIVVIVLLVKYITAGEPKPIDGIADSKDKTLSIEERIAPVAKLNFRDPNAPIVYKSGEEVYKNACAACHDTGAAGAPKTGSSDWTNRAAQGYETLLKHAINGIRGMPPRGGTSPDDYSDFEIGRAIVHMVNASGGKMAEPTEPAKVTPTTNAAAESGMPTPASSPAASISTDSPVADRSPGNTTAAATPVTETPAPMASSSIDGKAIYEQSCVACHGGSGIGPTLGDKAAWAPRLSKGLDGLYQSALKGINAMPPKGGFAGTDEEFKAAVEYLVSSSK